MTDCSSRPSVLNKCKRVAASPERIAASTAGRAVLGLLCQLGWMLSSWIRQAVSALGRSLSTRRRIPVEAVAQSNPYSGKQHIHPGRPPCIACAHVAA